ncbi:MAG: hypothetical protein DYH13_11260 [Alphaproteobacteria bacterium PRO2]|nr:hypothetical protein [Alphaproteobacteria bacterium PRO2]
MFSRALKSLMEACALYRDGKISIGDYKARVYEAAQQLTALEDKELRIFLQEKEAELDSMQFTVDEKKLFDMTLPVVNQIEQRIKNALPAPD